MKKNKIYTMKKSYNEKISLSEQTCAPTNSKYRLGASKMLKPEVIFRVDFQA